MTKLITAMFAASAGFRPFAATTPNLNDLRNKLVNLSEAARGIQALADAEDRDLSSDENDRINALFSEFDVVEQQIAQVAGHPAAALDLGSARRITTPVDAVRRVADSPNDPKAAKQMTAFYDFVRTGSPQAALTLTDGEGGYTVPSAIDSQIQKVAALYSPLRQLARVVKSIGTYSQIVAKGLPSVAWIGTDTDARPETATPAFAKVTFPHGEIYAAAAITAWLQDDSQHDLGAFINQEIGRGQGVAEGTAFAAGNGVGKPKGLTAQTFANTADGVRAFGTLQYLASGTSGAGITIDKLIELFYKLSPEYRVPGRCKWLMSPAVLETLRKERAVANGSYQWQPATVDGQPSTLLGCPVFEDSNLTVAADTLPVFCGDFQRGYTIVDVGAPRFIRDDVTTRGQTIFYVARRVGGNITDSNAIKALKLSAA